MIAIPTKQGHIPDAIQCMKFMMLCKARHLNPFEGDAYLIGYDTQNGPQFSLITAHQVYLKRAEASESFDGMESGVIVDCDDELISEREGDLVYEGEKLIGGWAKVYRKDRSRPFYKRLKLSTFNTNRSRWQVDPAGLIVKCTEADALRTAFPTHLGGLYMREELEPIDITPKAAAADIQFGPAGLPEPKPSAPLQEKPKRHRRTKAQIEADKQKEGDAPSSQPQEETNMEGPSEVKAAPESKPPSAAPPRATPLEGLRNLIKASPVKEEEFVKYLIQTMRMEPHEKLENLSEDRLLIFQGEYMTIANAILDQKEEAPF